MSRSLSRSPRPRVGCCRVHVSVISVALIICRSQTVCVCCVGTAFTSLVFASFGTPSGSCPSYSYSSCHAANTSAIVTAACMYKTTCTIAVTTQLFGDPCPSVIDKYLVVQMGTNGTYYMGLQGASCASACQGYGLACNPTMSSWDSPDIFGELNINCTADATPWSSAVQPAYVSDTAHPDYGKCQGW